MDVAVSQRRELTHEMARTGVTRSSGSFELICAAALFGFFGWFIDGFTDTMPLFTVIGAAVGFCLSAIGMVFQYKARMDAESAERAAAAAR